MNNPYDSPPASPRFTTLGPNSPALSSAQQIHLQPPSTPFGEIKLIGAGPGDPDLLTMAAYKAITSWADIVLADKLVSKEILALVKCSLFVANKDKGCQASGQQELFERATQALKEGKKVVRLKQGDPFIFGRGGEEFLFFRRLGYEATIVPGLSSSIAGPLLAQIPLTHRGIASQFLVCTGTGKLDTIPDMPTYVAHRTTVFLMALHRLEDLVQDLIRAGYPLDLPVAIVERASAKDQRCIRATVETVVQTLKEAKYRPPGILIVGWACDALAQNPDQLGGLTAGSSSIMDSQE
ncbi:MAG: tetrapyrrole methylase [Linnemannia elongata]|nr:MAG: tetrapyrrole methylase [Linnemannia elongata]